MENWQGGIGSAYKSPSKRNIPCIRALVQCCGGVDQKVIVEHLCPISYKTPVYSCGVR